MVGVNPANIKNKIKRSEVYQKQKEAKAKDKKDRRKRDVEAAALGDEVPVKKVQRTLDNTREADETVVAPDDEEVEADEAGDEFARFFNNETTPKIMITTRPRPSAELFMFIRDLMQMLPNAFFYPRKSATVKQLCQWCNNKKFTHLFVLSEKSKVCNGLLVAVLPAGPTAFFKVSNVKTSEDIHNRGTVSPHQPELILNNFNTRLGHRVGRFLGSVFPHEPDFNGRQVVTFHNQRDFIFVRHHRYVFEGNELEAAAAAEVLDEGDEGQNGGAGEGGGHKKKVATLKGKDGSATRTRLQELGPRFTLKMRWLQEGTFDTECGEYEWIHKRKEMDTSRRKFHL
ncbi:anticodon-binding protein [Tribonema minus]|uniref:Anticodon-binding protein n=1 Tax=Tribonema minus TaxID=303371 RepID=A0A835YUA9_9STRA|nr:anticodon-binding protein [Tribonema minus]